MATLKELLARRSDLREDLRIVQEKIDVFRVKCPTCRCRILPGQACACCAGAEPDAAIEALI